MYKIVQIALLAVILCHAYVSYPQSSDSHFNIPDSLKNNSYEEIYERFMKNRKDTLQSLVYLRSCLEKAKSEVDSLKMTEIYAYLSYYEKSDSIRLAFLDTSIRISKNLEHPRYPAYQYSSKGGFYLGKWNYEKALDNYLMALHYAKKNKNEDYQYLTQHNIGIIKSKLGKHKEALDIFKECLAYEERIGVEDTLDYLEIMVDLTESYTKNGKVDSSNFYLKKVLPISKRYDQSLYAKFSFIQGVNLYQVEQYDMAEEILKRSLPDLTMLEDKREMVNTYYYLGKIYEYRTNETETIHFYKKVDSVFKRTEFITPEVRDGYSYLISHYKNKQDHKNQLLYVERLLKFDSILYKNNIVINEKLIKKFDTAALLAEKEKLIDVVHSKNSNFKIFIWILIGVVALLSALFFYQFNKRKLYAKRFKALVEKNSYSIERKMNKIDTGTIKADEIRKLKISEDIKKDILDKIAKFEKNKGFLEPNITTNSLATQFKTNSKYISRIINIYKEKNFTNYINDLRIDYLIEELKTNKKFRNYTIKAISSEVGFNTTEAFSKYFHKRTGLYPSYFIKKMKEFAN